MKDDNHCESSECKFFISNTNESLIRPTTFCNLKFEMNFIIFCIPEIYAWFFELNDLMCFQITLKF